MPDRRRLQAAVPEGGGFAEGEDDMAVEMEKQAIADLYGGNLGSAVDVDYGRQTNYTDEGGAFPVDQIRVGSALEARSRFPEPRGFAELAEKKRQQKEAEDSVPLEAPPEKFRIKKQFSRTGGLKLLVILFLLFVFVSSTVFTNNVLSMFGGAVQGRYPTSWGVVLQGIFLVIGFVLFSHLVDNKTI